MVVDTPRTLQRIQTNDSGGVNYGAFSSRWYKRQNSDVLKGVRTSCESTVRNVFPSNSKVFWTTFKGYKDDLVGKGYRQGWNDVETFVSKSKRASNDHADGNCCMYLVNVFPHMDVRNFVQYFGIDMNWD